MRDKRARGLLQDGLRQTLKFVLDDEYQAAED